MVRVRDAVGAVMLAAEIRGAGRVQCKGGFPGATSRTLAAARATVCAARGRGEVACRGRRHRGRGLAAGRGRSGQCRASPAVFALRALGQRPARPRRSRLDHIDQDPAMVARPHSPGAFSAETLTRWTMEREANT